MRTTLKRGATTFFIFFLFFCICDWRSFYCSCCRRSSNYKAIVITTRQKIGQEFVSSTPKWTKNCIKCWLHLTFLFRSLGTIVFFVWGLRYFFNLSENLWTIFLTIFSYVSWYIKWILSRFPRIWGDICNNLEFVDQT